MAGMAGKARRGSTQISGSVLNVTTLLALTSTYDCLIPSAFQYNFGLLSLGLHVLSKNGNDLWIPVWVYRPPTALMKPTHACYIWWYHVTCPLNIRTMIIIFPPSCLDVWKITFRGREWSANLGENPICWSTLIFLKTHFGNFYGGPMYDKEILCRTWPRFTQIFIYSRSISFATFSPYISDFLDWHLH